MKKTILSIWALLALLTSVSVAYGKGSTDKISIIGAGLAHPLETTTPNTLEGFSPWGGEFFDRTRGNWGRLTETPTVTQTYNVFFYIRDNNNKPQLIYVFRYAFDPSGAQGYIYIPTEGEAWYVMNSATIARPSGWYYANREWDKFMRQVLANKSEARLNASLAQLLWGEVRR